MTPHIYIHRDDAVTSSRIVHAIAIEYSILILAFNIHFIDLEILISAFLYFIFNFCKLGNAVPTHLISSVAQIEY